MVAWISLRELDLLSSDESPVLVEALSVDFYVAGHLPGAANLPLSSTDEEIAAFATTLRTPASGTWRKSRR